PGMLERDRGAVVTIASAAGLTGVARQTDYSASKWAAVGFTESLRSELRAEGSRVGTLVVCPFYINTGMFDGVRTKFPRLLPILEETDVSTRVLDAIESGREQLVMPPLVRLVPGVRLLPTRAFDKVMDSLGVNQTMDHFTARTQQPSAANSVRRRQPGSTMDSGTHGREQSWPRPIWSSKEEGRSCPESSAPCSP